MSCSTLYAVALFFLPAVSAVVQLSITSEPVANTEVQILYTREDSDPRVWVLRPAKDGRKMGATTTVYSGDQLSGVASVVFPEPGEFTLQAINPDNNQTIAYVAGIQVVGNPPMISSSSSQTDPSSTSSSSDATSTSSTSASATSSSVIPSSSSSIPSSDSTAIPSSSTPEHASSKTPAIIGGVIGGVLFLVVVAILAVVFHRRRRRSPRRITFDRDLMVQRRDIRSPTTYDVERSPMPSLDRSSSNNREGSLG